MQHLRIVFIFALIIILFGGIFVVSNSGNDEPADSAQRVGEPAQATTGSDENPQATADSADTVDRLIIGDPNASATVVEYLDYKCPSCNNFHRTTAKQIEQQYVTTNQANFEIRMTPVIGPDSARAARGAYCANEQGEFVQYHNTVLNYMWNNYYADGNFAAEFDDILTIELLNELIDPLDVNKATFTQCVNSDTYNDAIDRNLLQAADDEIRGTPGFAIGDQSFVGGQPLTVFTTLLDIELR